MDNQPKQMARRLSSCAITVDITVHCRKPVPLAEQLNTNDARIRGRPCGGVTCPATRGFMSPSKSKLLELLALASFLLRLTLDDPPEPVDGVALTVPA